MIDYFHTAKKHGQTQIREEYDTSNTLEKSDILTVNFPLLPPTDKSDLTVSTVICKAYEQNLIPMYADHYFEELKDNVKIWDCPKVQLTRARDITCGIARHLVGFT